MAPAGLSAVLLSRRSGSPASHSKFYPAALRGTCCYPWRNKTAALRNSKHLKARSS